MFDGCLEVHAVDEVVGVVGTCRQVSMSAWDSALVSVVTADVYQRQHSHYDAKCQSDDRTFHAGRRPQHGTVSRVGTQRQMRRFPALGRRRRRGIRRRNCAGCWAQSHGLWCVVVATDCGRAECARCWLPMRCRSLWFNGRRLHTQRLLRG